MVILVNDYLKRYYNLFSLLLDSLLWTLIWIEGSQGYRTSFTLSKVIAFLYLAQQFTFMSLYFVSFRRGIGWHLLKASEELISEMSFSREVYLHCRMIDAAPFNMYAKAGYSIVKTDSILILLMLQRRKHLMCKKLQARRSLSDMSDSDEEWASWMDTWTITIYMRYKHFLPCFIYLQQNLRPSCAAFTIFQAFTVNFIYLQKNLAPLSLISLYLTHTLTWMWINIVCFSIDISILFG